MQQQTNILNSPFPFPRSAMEFFFASEDEMHVITVSSIYLILILLNHCFKIHIVPNRIFIQHYSIGDSIFFYLTQVFKLLLYIFILFTFLSLNIYFSFLYSNTSEDCKLHSFPLSYLTFYVIWLVYVFMSRFLYLIKFVKG